jgi:acyl carrier protein
MTSAVGTGTDTVLDFVTEVLTELTQEWDLGELDPGLRLGELGLESISLVYLIAEVQHEFGLGARLLQALRADERLDVRAMTIRTFAAFAGRIAQGSPAAAGAQP